jgi:hypothetical protein
MVEKENGLKNALYGRTGLLVMTMVMVDVPRRRHKKKKANQSSSVSRRVYESL